MLRAVETITKTDTGLQRRDNEDSAFARAPVFVVADGMGGAQGGEIASRLAVEAFEQELSAQGTAEERLAGRALEANRRIHELSQTQHEHAGMGTTLTAAFLDNDDLAIAHVGDSRAYLFRDGALKRLTQDHSLVDELLRRGKLTEEQAADHPQRSIITRALGPEPHVEVDTWRYPLHDADVVLLCSDGLTSMVAEDQMAEILRSADRLDGAAQNLIEAANNLGGRDNITVVLFRLEQVGVGADAQNTAIVPAISPGGEAHASAHGRPVVPVAPAPRSATRATVAPAPPAPAPVPGPRTVSSQPGPPVRPRHRRYAKPAAAAIATAVVLFLLGAGGWLATRQLFFVGTNAQGIVTVFRGLPYDLPAGVRLYESFYVSGVPASMIPAARRARVLDHHLRSQADATGLVRDLERGKVQG